jgi:hypothetical protein
LKAKVSSDHTPSVSPGSPWPLYSNQVPLTEVIEPLDFEDVLLSRPPEVEPGPLRDLIEFPVDDLELLKQPRECRTTESGVPEDGCVLCMRVLTYIYIYIYIYTHTHTHTHESHTPRFTYRLWTPVWPWVNHCPSLSLHLLHLCVVVVVCGCMCMRMCMCACMYVCAHVCVSVHVCICMHSVDNCEGSCIHLCRGQRSNLEFSSFSFLLIC